MNLILKNSKTGETKAIKAGWSWILFLFSSFLGIPLFMRKLYVWGAIFLTLWIINSVVPLFLPLALATAFSIGIMLIFIGLQVFMGIKGNEMTAKNYLENGWSIADPESELTKLAAARLGISVQLAMPEKETQSVNLTALCVSCGQEIVRQAKFCKHCGSSQQKTDQISTPAEPHFAKATVLHQVEKSPPSEQLAVNRSSPIPAQVTKTANEINEKSESRSQKFSLTIALVVGLLAVGIGAYIWNNKQETDAKIAELQKRTDEEAKARQKLEEEARAKKAAEDAAKEAKSEVATEQQPPSPIQPQQVQASNAQTLSVDILLSTISIPESETYTHKDWSALNALNLKLKPCARGCYQFGGPFTVENLGEAMISFFGPRAGIEEIFLDVPVWNIADHEARVAKLFSKSTRVSKIRGKCAEDGVISGSTIYEVTLLTKKPLYLFVSTDAGGNSPNSQSTVLQFALRNLERWKCSSIPSHLTYSHGTYVGEVANGKANGQGTYTASASGTVYKGSFVNDSFNGSGTMTWKDGAQYVGTWQNDVGVQGTMTYPNGKKASGTVRKGVFTPSN